MLGLRGEGGKAAGDKGKPRRLLSKGDKDRPGRVGGAEVGRTEVEPGGVGVGEGDGGLPEDEGDVVEGGEGERPPPEFKQVPPLRDCRGCSPVTERHPPCSYKWILSSPRRPSC